MSAEDVLKAVLSEQGAAFPGAGALLLLDALEKAGFTVVERGRYCSRCGSVFPVDHRCGRDRV